MKMDRNSSDHSPTLSDNGGGSWMQYWQSEFSSISGLNLDRSSELHKLVEDKEIAARAVAFVVNSSRKGIVPLCADVAHLLRAKKSLECKLLKTRRENDALRQTSTSCSARTSHSASPTPPSVHSMQDQSSQTQGSPRSTSSCSQTSSYISGNHGNSPKVSKFQTVNSALSPPRTISVDNNVNLTVVTKADIHMPRNGLLADAVVNLEPELYAAEFSNKKRRPLSRKNSLPEIVSQPCGNVPKVSPRAIKCKGTQCLLVSATPDSVLEEQLRETACLNCKLSEELGAAHKEIEVLKGRVKELEMNIIAQQYTERFYRENDCDAAMDRNITTSDDELCYLPVTKVTHNASDTRSSPRLRSTKRSLCAPFTLPGPLPECRCDACQTQLLSRNNTIQMCNGEDKRCSTSSLQIHLDDRVVVKGKRTGHVRYMGHLDNIGQAEAMFVGLELDAPVGRHDGYLDGKRYFECDKDHGIFLPLQEVICIVRKEKKSTDIYKEKSLKEERENSSDYLRRSKQDTHPGKLPRSPKHDPDTGYMPRSPKHDPDTGCMPRSPKHDPDTGSMPRSPKHDPDSCKLPRSPKHDMYSMKSPKPPRVDGDSGKLPRSPKLDPLQSTRREGDGCPKTEQEGGLKADKEKASRKQVDRLSRTDSAKVKPHPEAVADRALRKDTETSTSSVDRGDALRVRSSRVSEMARPARPAKKSTSPNLERRERQRTVEKRRAHEAIPINRDLSITDGELV